MAQRKARRSASKKTKAAGKRPAPKRKATRRPARKAAPPTNKRVAEREAENRRLRDEVDRLRSEIGGPSLDVRASPAHELRRPPVSSPPSDPPRSDTATHAAREVRA